MSFLVTRVLETRLSSWGTRLHWCWSCNVAETACYGWWVFAHSSLHSGFASNLVHLARKSARTRTLSCHLSSKRCFHPRFRSSQGFIVSRDDLVTPCGVCQYLPESTQRFDSRGSWCNHAWLKGSSGVSALGRCSASLPETKTVFVLLLSTSSRGLFETCSESLLFAGPHSRPMIVIGIAESAVDCLT